MPVHKLACLGNELRPLDQRGVDIVARLRDGVTVPVATQHLEQIRRRYQPKAESPEIVRPLSRQAAAVLQPLLDVQKTAQRRS